MTHKYDLVGLPLQRVLRQPGGPRTIAGNTLAQPGAPRHFHDPETKDVLTDHGRPKGAAATPQRRVTADPPTDLPDPDRARTQMRSFLAAAGAVLDEQPNARTIRSTGLRLHQALTCLVDDTARRKAC